MRVAWWRSVTRCGRMSTALYDRIGVGYSRYRSPDARIARRIVAALGESKSVLNVGAGAGSYEPSDRAVVAVDASMEMLRQRTRAQASAVLASADRLPFWSKSFDAALAILTIHHWQNFERGIAELQRIARDRVVILTWDPDHPGFWLVRDYFPEILEIDRAIFPTIGELGSLLGPSDIQMIEIPADCSDGFLGAYWCRPKKYLDPHARSAISTFSKLREVDSRLRALHDDLENGSWQRRNGELLGLPALDIGYRLVVATPEDAGGGHNELSRISSGGGTYRR